MKIVLIGFACSYKTSVGKILAKKLGYDFVDIDDEITRLAGCSIKDIFTECGEKEFRNFESRALDSCYGIENTVIACGGGSATLKEFEALAKESTIVWLKVNAKTVFDRLDGTSRPLFDNLSISELDKILAQRNAVYALCAQDIAIETDGLTSLQVSELVYAAFINQS